MVSSQHIQGRAVNRVAYPTSRRRTVKARGLSVVTETDYAVEVVYPGVKKYNVERKELVQLVTQKGGTYFSIRQRRLNLQSGAC